MLDGPTGVLFTQSQSLKIVRFTESYLKKGLTKPLNRRNPLIDRRVVDRNPPRPSRKPAESRLAHRRGRLSNIGCGARSQPRDGRLQVLRYGRPRATSSPAIGAGDPVPGNNGCRPAAKILSPAPLEARFTMPAPVIEPPIGSAAYNLPIPGEHCRKRFCC